MGDSSRFHVRLVTPEDVVVCDDFGVGTSLPVSGGNFLQTILDAIQQVIDFDADIETALLCFPN